MKCLFFFLWEYKTLKILKQEDDIARECVQKSTEMEPLHKGMHSMKFTTHFFKLLAKNFFNNVMKLFLKHLTQSDDEPGNNTSQ